MPLVPPVNLYEASLGDTSWAATNHFGGALPRLGLRKDFHEVTSQYLRLRADAQTETFPPLPHLNKTKLDPAVEEQRERSQLFVKTDCKRAYFPGQVVEAILAADREMVDAVGGHASEGFASLHVRFEGIVTSYACGGSVGTANSETLVLFSDSVTLKRAKRANDGSPPVSPVQRPSRVTVSSSSPPVQSHVPIDGGNGERASVTGLTVEPLTLPSPEGGEPRLCAWYVNAVFPRVVNTSYRAPSKNNPFQRKTTETHTIILPPTFSDHRNRLSSTNTVSYRLVFEAVPFAATESSSRKSFSSAAQLPLGRPTAPKKSITVVPLLFLPLQDGPSPPSDLNAPPDYTDRDFAPVLVDQPPEQGPMSSVLKRRRSSAQAKPTVIPPLAMGPWLRLRHQETIKKNMFGGHSGTVTLEACLADPIDVPMDSGIPISLLCTVSSKDKSDLVCDGFLSPAALDPAQGSTASVEHPTTWPYLYILRTERGRVGWDREQVTNIIPVTPMWDVLLNSIAPNARTDTHEAQAHNYLAPTFDKKTGVWSRTAHLLAHLACRVPPPVATPTLDVTYDLHLSWKPFVRWAPLLARWSSATGVDSATLQAQTERHARAAEWARIHMALGQNVAITEDTSTLTRMVTGSKMHTLLTSIKDPSESLLRALMPVTPLKTSRYGQQQEDVLPSYEGHHRSTSPPGGVPVPSATSSAPASIPSPPANDLHFIPSSAIGIPPTPNDAVQAK